MADLTVAFDAAVKVRRTTADRLLPSGSIGRVGGAGRAGRRSRDAEEEDGDCRPPQGEPPPQRCAAMRRSVQRRYLRCPACRSTALWARGAAGLSAPPPPAGKTARAPSSRGPRRMAARARRWTTQRTARSRACWTRGRRGASARRRAAAASARGGERWKSRRRTAARSAAARRRPTHATLQRAQNGCAGTISRQI
jgi:hypothetical protein